MASFVFFSRPFKQHQLFFKGQPTHSTPYPTFPTLSLSSPLRFLTLSSGLLTPSSFQGLGGRRNSCHEPLLTLPLTSCPPPCAQFLVSFLPPLGSPLPFPQPQQSDQRPPHAYRKAPHKPHSIPIERWRLCFCAGPQDLKWIVANSAIPSSLSPILFRGGWLHIFISMWYNSFVGERVRVRGGGKGLEGHGRGG